MVIHADKYTQTSGGWGNLPVHSNLYTDVVFRNEAAKEDWHLKINNFDLPLYNGQHVMVIRINDIIIGFVDKQTSKYYYTRTDFSKACKLGMPYYWVWVIGISAGLIGFVLTKENAYPLPVVLLIPTAMMWLIYQAQKWIRNNNIRGKIDQYLREA